MVAVKVVGVVIDGGGGWSYRSVVEVVEVEVTEMALCGADSVGG